MTLDSGPAELRAHRLALALVTLLTLGDQDGARRLVDELTAEELRTVLLIQASNVRECFMSWSLQARLVAVADKHGRPLTEVKSDYLGLRILRMAQEEFRDGGGDASSG